jgi:hypothetical protein
MYLTDQTRLIMANTWLLLQAAVIAIHRLLKELRLPEWNSPEGRQQKLLPLTGIISIIGVRYVLGHATRPSPVVVAALGAEHPL